MLLSPLSILNVSDSISFLCHIRRLYNIFHGIMCNILDVFSWYMCNIIDVFSSCSVTEIHAVILSGCSKNIW
jgi:hypothetical protein